MSDRRLDILVAAGSVMVAFVAFSRILTAGFTADDWYFLELVHNAPNVSVAIHPLAGRFLRPLVVLSYYIPYQLARLTTWPYHVGLVAVHAINTFLVFRLAQRMTGTGERLRPTLAALVFALMAPHSEAIAWYASIADPLATLFMLASLLAFGRALHEQRPARSVAIGSVLFILALASKETAIVFPVIVLGYVLLAVERREGHQPTHRLALLFASGPTALACTYLLMRVRIFGSPLAAYAGFGSSTGVFLQQARAFLLRTFLPPGDLLSRWWADGSDIYLFIAAACAFAWTILARDDRRAILFALAALVIVLAPAMPLSISLSSTVSERFVYAATAFSSIATVWTAARLLRRPAVLVAVIVVFASFHARALWTANQTWAEAGQLFSDVLDSVIARVRQDGTGRDRTIHILTLPDNLRGAFVFRNAFYPALKLTAPDIVAPEQRIAGVTSHDTMHVDDAIVVTQVGGATFSIDLRANTFVQSAAPDRPPYHFTAWSRTSCTVEITSASGLVLYATRGQIAVAADLDRRQEKGSDPFFRKR